MPRKPPKKRRSRKRELIEPTKGDKRYVRRNKRGEFGAMVDVGRSLAADRRRNAKKVSRPGFGDKGDRKPAKKRRTRRETEKKLAAVFGRAFPFGATPKDMRDLSKYLTKLADWVEAPSTRKAGR